jgi:hypothetical protein
LFTISLTYGWIFDLIAELKPLPIATRFKHKMDEDLLARLRSPFF